MLIRNQTIVYKEHSLNILYKLSIQIIGGKYKITIFVTLTKLSSSGFDENSGFSARIWDDM